MLLELITLTVQPARNRKFGIYRLGIDSNVSNKYFYKPLKVKIKLRKSDVFEVSIACGPPSKSGYDLNKKEISNWIIENDFHKYVKGSPTKLKFELHKQEGIFTLIYCTH